MFAHTRRPHYLTLAACAFASSSAVAHTPKTANT